jgi:hypothetical protein
MASIISAGTTSNTAINISGDTSGNLAFTTQAGANTITVPNSTGTILTTGSPQSGGVIQTVQGSTSTGYGTSLTSTPVAITGLTASISPKFSTSKVLVIVSVQGLYFPNGGASNDCFQIYLYKNGSNLVTIQGQLGYRGTTAPAYDGGTNYSYLDSPATTSSTTYAIYWSFSNTRSCNIMVGGETCTIQLMEIAQ